MHGALDRYSQRRKFSAIGPQVFAILLPGALILAWFRYGGIIALIMGMGHKAVEVEQAQVVHKKGELTREEFKKLVVGKTRAELLKLLGSPSSMAQLPAGDEDWRFELFVIDPIGGNAQTAVIAFKKDVDAAKSCRFY